MCKIYPASEHPILYVLFSECQTLRYVLKIYHVMISSKILKSLI